MKRQQVQLQKQQREREIAEGEERIHAEHHHPTLPQDYYSSQLPLQNHNNEFPPNERALSYGKIINRNAFFFKYVNTNIFYLKELKDVLG